MVDLLRKPSTTRAKKCEHAEVLVNIYMKIKNITSLMDGSAFGRNTRHNNTNIDLYLRAMDEVEEHANAEVVKKKSAFGQAKPAKFPQGELFAANDDLTPQKKRGKRKEDSPTHLTLNIDFVTTHMYETLLPI